MGCDVKSAQISWFEWPSCGNTGPHGLQGACGAFFCDRSQNRWTTGLRVKQARLSAFNEPGGAPRRTQP